MPVKTITASRPSPATRTAQVASAEQSLLSATKHRAGMLSQYDSQISRVVASFSNKSRKFAPTKLRQISASLSVMDERLSRAHAGSLSHYRTAIQLGLPTVRVISQAEDASAIRTKIALVRQMIRATLADDNNSDQLVNVDDAGYVVDDYEDPLNDLPQAPDVDAADGDPMDPNSMDPSVPGAPDDQNQNPTSRRQLQARRQQSRQRRADYRNVEVDEPQDLDDRPVNVPEEELPETQTDPSDAGSRGVPPRTTQKLTEARRREMRRRAMDMFRRADAVTDDPVGVPDVVDYEDNLCPDDDYSSQPLKTDPPSSTIKSNRQQARRRQADVDSGGPGTTWPDNDMNEGGTQSRQTRRAGPEDNLGDYLQDDDSTRSSRRTRAEDDSDPSDNLGDFLNDDGGGDSDDNADPAPKKDAGRNRRRAENSAPSLPPSNDDYPPDIMPRQDGGPSSKPNPTGRRETRASYAARLRAGAMKLLRQAEAADMTPDNQDDFAQAGRNRAADPGGALPANNPKTPASPPRQQQPQAARRRRAEDTEPPNGQDLEHDRVAGRNRRAESNDGDDPNYSANDPGTVQENVRTSRRRRADGDNPNAPDMQNDDPMSDTNGVSPSSIDSFINAAIFESDDAHPDADPANDSDDGNQDGDVTATARRARRASASRSPMADRGSGDGKPGDLFRRMIAQEMQF